MSEILIANWNLQKEALGGQESFFKTLAEALNAKMVSYTKAESTYKNYLFSDAFNIVYRGYVIDNYLKWYENLFNPKLIIRNSAVGGFMEFKTPQIIIFQDPYYSIFNKMLEEGIFLSICEHYLACINLQQRTAKQGKTVAVSNFMKRDMELCGIKCDKVIEEGIDTEKFKPVENKEELKKMHGLPLDKKIGIAVTKFTITKGWDILAKLINKFPDIHWIVIMTEKKGSKPKLKNVTLAEQVNPEIMQRFYNCADFFINTSPVESFGLSSVEAASCNLPIIVYKTGWAWDWWDEKLGIRVDDWNNESFEKAVQEMYSILNKNSEKVDNIIYSPRKIIIERGFTKEVMTKNWKDFIDNFK